MSSQARKSSEGGNKRSLDDRRGVSDAQSPADKIDNSNCSIASSDSEELGKTPSKSAKLDTSPRQANNPIDIERSKSRATPDEALARNPNDKAAATMPVESQRPASQTEDNMTEVEQTKPSSSKCKGRQSAPKAVQTVLPDAASNQSTAGSSGVAAEHSMASLLQAYVSDVPTKPQQQHMNQMQDNIFQRQQRAEDTRQASQYLMHRRSTQPSVVQPQDASRTGPQVALNTRHNPSLMTQKQTARDQAADSTNWAPQNQTNDASWSCPDQWFGRVSALPPNAQPHQPPYANIQAKRPESGVLRDVQPSAHNNHSEARILLKRHVSHLNNQQPGIPTSSNVDSGRLRQPPSHPTAIGHRAYSQNGLGLGQIKVGNIILEPIQAVEYLLDENHRLVDVNSIYIGRSGEVNRLNDTIADLNYKLADLNSKLAQHSNLIEEKNSLRHEIIQRDAIIAQLSANLQRSQQNLQRQTPMMRQSSYWDAVNMQNRAAPGQQSGQPSSRARASTAVAQGGGSQRQWPRANGFRSDEAMSRDGEQAKPVEKGHVQDRAEGGGPSGAN
ncbi:hypothetical protein HII31_09521 [Pseudocercospora fuligena]|uniref:Uncharacterized protein n=1 Tax=Pseudocercospora fuligena TaxID=685502 RepID=A0A8H6RCJ3_9PEZI|nr:hypothetical protein HII31_09521 [Pseudocercospora fuligena]